MSDANLKRASGSRSSRRPPSGGGRGWRAVCARVLVPFLVLTQTLQPAAYAAPSSTLFSPVPMFLDLAASSNVLFVLDDSLSMNDIRLPVPTQPAGLNPQEALFGNVTLKDGSVVERVNEWIFRTALFNPLYYNPEITYKPWNDNGREGKKGNFGSASTAVKPHANGFREGLVRQDMRYTGPNYTAASGDATQRQPLSTKTGANPPTDAIPPSPHPMATLFANPADKYKPNWDRPRGGGFEGTTLSSKDALPSDPNQDIFSSPFAQALLSNYCEAGWRPSSYTPSTSGRPGTPWKEDRSASTRKVIARASQGRPFVEKTSTETVQQAALPNVARPIAGTLTPSNRDTDPRSSSLKPASVTLGPSDVVGRESWNPVYGRTPFKAKTQYRMEKKGTFCGKSYTDWETLDSRPSPDGTCKLTEGGGNESKARVVLVQSQSEPCGTGHKTYGAGDQCIAECKSGETESGTSCIRACLPEYPNKVGTGTSTMCYKNCDAGLVPYPGDDSKCIKACPPDTERSATNPFQCLGKCPTTTHPTEIGGTCYGGCPSGTEALNPATDTVCYKGCAPGSVYDADKTKCIAACSPGQELIGTTCYGSCAGLKDDKNNKTETPEGSLCVGSCDNANKFSRDGTKLICLGPCKNGSDVEFNGYCYAKCDNDEEQFTTADKKFLCLKGCPSGYPNVKVGDARTCLNRCTVNSVYGDLKGETFNASGVLTADGSCYNTDCSLNAGTEVHPTDFTQCLTKCKPEQAAITEGSGPTTKYRCQNACASPNEGIGDTCYSECTAPGSSVVTTDRTKCTGTCVDEYSKLDGGKCLCVDKDGKLVGSEGSIGKLNPANAPNDCCPVAIEISGCPNADALPAGYTCNATNPTAFGWYPLMKFPALARYYRFVPVATDVSPTVAELNNPANYVLVEINRDSSKNFPRRKDSFDKPWKNNDPTQGRAAREDCGIESDTCTWEQEAQNFANWYTYYRTRLFSAIAVTAEALSNLTALSTLDSLRLGYGSYSYFPGGLNVYSGQYFPTGDNFKLDGQPSVGTLVRGVRPFTEKLPVPDPGSNDPRQEVFDWLFSVRGAGLTPTREAVDALGRYLTRTDDRGPWINDKATTAAAWQTSEEAGDHIACRRNYAIVITDGEWTVTDDFTPPDQPLMANRTATDLPSTFVSTSQPYVPQTAIGLDGPLHKGEGLAIGSEYQYKPASEPHISSVSGSPTGTLADVTLFWWSRDLRTDLLDNIKPVTEGNGNEAFWQSLTTYLVGYGVTASRDTAQTRADLAAKKSISWPKINTSTSVVRDDDAACTTFAGTEPASGCGRRNDVLRAAFAGRGDFLSATDVGALAKRVAAVFDVIAEQEGSGTGVVATATRVGSEDLVLQASFISKRWSGKLAAFTGSAFYAQAKDDLALPAPKWTANFPDHESRVLLTSTDKTGAGAAFATITELNADQQAQVGSQDVLDYLRGDHSKELGQTGGVYRPRSTLLADIVNSHPLFSRARDFLYSSARVPAAAKSGAANYPAYVKEKGKSKRAAVFVGANGGVFHAFDAANGTELFGYVPRAVYGQLSLLASPEYDHRYFVDGPSTEGDVYLNDTWRTVVVGTTGMGGAWSAGSARLGGSVFALDVTEPEKMTKSQVLWDLTGADHDDIGHILQPGFIGSAQDGNWYYFVGNGYESKNDKSRLLAINIADGSVLSLVTDDAGGNDPAASNAAGRPNGMGGITPVFDSNRNIVAIYGGDKLGRMWKFDLSNATTATSLGEVKGIKLFEAKDGAGADALRQPITAAPLLMEHPFGGNYVVFGTGKFFERPDREEVALQSIYALWEKSPDSPSEVARADLAKLTLGDATAPTATADGQCVKKDEKRSARILTGVDGIDFAKSKGFFFDLIVGASATGERALVVPVADAGFANFQTFEPQAGGDPCSGGGRSYAYRLDLGGSFSRAPFADRNKQCVAFSYTAQAASAGNQALLGAGVTGDAATSTNRVLKRADLEVIMKNAKRQRVDSTSSGVASSIGAGVLSTPTYSGEQPTLRAWRELPPQ